MRDLDAFIAARSATPFAYFDHDCAGIVAEWVQVATGRDPLADLRADGGALAARNLLAALRLVRAAGGWTDAITARLGPALPPLMAQRGDVVLITSGRPIGQVRGYTCGICTGSHIVVPDNQGLVFQPLSTGVAAWRV